MAAIEQEVPHPPAIGACQEPKPSRFLHSFGYHLATRLVGKNPMDACIRQAYDDLLRQQQQSSLLTVCATADEAMPLFTAFGSNWRSNVRFPWQLPVSSSGVKGEGSDRNLDVNDWNINHLIQSLFVDITFDFLIFPANLFLRGNDSMMHSCHLLDEKDFWKEADHSLEAQAISFPIAISVAIRVGALLALPTPQIGGRVSASTVKRTGDDGRAHNVWRCGKSMNDDGYRYYYHRGNTALTMSDLNEHCKSIDIVLEEMDPYDVARIFGDAFIERCKSGDSWEITSTKWNATLGDNGAKTCTNYSHGKATNSEGYSGLDSRHLEHDLGQSRYYIKLHHGILQADGVLPLSTSRSNDNGDNRPIEAISRSMLDVILLQSKCSGCDGVCVTVPRSDAIALWRGIDSRIVTELEEQREEMQRQELNSIREIAMQARGITSITNNSNPGTAAAPAKLVDANKHNESYSSSSSYNNGKSLLSRPPQPPNESALFARVKSTAQGGSRKKPKFRLGPA